MIKQKDNFLKSDDFTVTALFFFFLIFLIVLPVGGQNKEKNNTEEITALEPGKNVEREFADGTEKHAYQIKMTAAQYVNVVVEQRGVDVQVSLLGDDGKQIIQFDNDSKPQGRENIELVAPAAGNYRLIIAPRYKNIWAGRYEIKIVALRASADNDLLRQESRDALAESVRLQQARKYDEAFAAADRACVALEKSGDANSFSYGLVLRRAGNVFFDKGEYEKAEDYLLRATKVLENALQPDDPAVSDTLNNLAVLYNTTGDYDKAEPILRRTLANQEKVFGENHPRVAAALNNLGNLYRRKGDYAKAEATHLRSLAVREKIFGPEQPEVVNALSGLSTVYYEKGDFVKAKEVDERALKINEKFLDPDDPKIADSLNNLALMLTELKDYAKAELMFKRALSIMEKTYGVDSVQTVGELNNLGKLYAHQGDYAKSDPFYQRALKIREKTLPPNHPDIARMLGNIAANYLFQGEYTKAEPLLQSQLTMREKALGAEHPDVARTLNTLARMYDAQGNIEQAVGYQTRANDLLEKYNKINLYAGSEDQQLAYFDFLAEQTDQLLSMQLHFPANTAARKLAVTAVLQRKGRVQDALADSIINLRRRFDAKDQKLLSDLSDTNAQLAELMMAGQTENQTEQQKQIKTLTERRENLEGEISRLSAGFYEQRISLTLDALQSEIPLDAALLEFAVYHPFKLQALKGEEQYGKPRYIVYVIRKQGDISYKDLGEAGQIDEAVRSLREALRDPERDDVSSLSRAVSEKLIEPIRSLLGNAEHLLVSPDGELNLLPFEALVDEQGKYLIENYAITYLTSGRDLLRMQTPRASKNKFLLIANPQFGEPAAEQKNAGNETRKTTVGKRKNKTFTRNLSDNYFVPLGGTLQEARSIQTLFPDAAMLTGAQATETALKQTVAPRILHIATHGFFLGNADENKSAANSQEPSRSSNAKAEAENLLLRSGLALAGANQHSSGSEDGILTALEASGLNLWGTKLVVLSACDTGVGEVKNGEGVYGLRRAFVLAGTETLVMSLWSVSDAETRRLMTSYYGKLKQGMGRGAGLRQVQLEMLKGKEQRRHPFYWAGFIQSGEWANLDGIR